jgi:uncharacterized protein YbaP (TraB family)
MKQLTRWISSILLLLPLTVSAIAAEVPKHPLKPLLWKLEGKGLSKTSYLFGTIHLGSGPLAKLHPAAEKAFQEADHVYTEIPIDENTQIQLAMQMIRKDQKTLSQSIGADLSDRVKEELQAINPALDLTPFQPMKTWFMAVSLPMLKAQLSGDKAMDVTLWKRAEAANKKTDSLESAESQLLLFDQFTEKEQIISLSETVRVMKEDREAKVDSTQLLIDAYVAGDVDALKKEIEKSFARMTEGEHKELGLRYQKALLEDRDQKMAKTISEKLKNAPDQCHFFAAGAAHFAGDASIRSHLEKMGYTITRIDQ